MTIIFCIYCFRSLCVLDKYETKIVDTVDIMATYHNYVPGNPDEEPIAIPLFGDALSVERANDAQNARVNAGNAWQQLHPCIQEWH